MTRSPRTSLSGECVVASAVGVGYADVGAADADNVHDHIRIARDDA